MKINYSIVSLLWLLTGCGLVGPVKTVVVTEDAGDTSDSTTKDEAAKEDQEESSGKVPVKFALDIDSATIYLGSCNRFLIKALDEDGATTNVAEDTTITFPGLTADM